MNRSPEALLAIIENFITANGARLREPLHLDTRLLQTGLLDSFALVSLAEEIAREWQLDLSPDALIPEDFETPRLLYERLKQLRPS